MKKSELMELVGKIVRVTFKDGDEDVGILKYVDEFSEKHGWHKPDYFYINGCNFCFKVSHIKKVEVLKMKECEDDAPLLEKIFKNGTPIPKRATNGDVIKALFPTFCIDKKTSDIWFGYGKDMAFRGEWWNAPYKTENKN